MNTGFKRLAPFDIKLHQGNLLATFSSIELGRYMNMVNIQREIKDLLRIQRCTFFMYTVLALGCMNDVSENIIYEFIFVLKGCKSRDRRYIIGCLEIDCAMASNFEMLSMVKCPQLCLFI
jgi:hypothetical protein